MYKRVCELIISECGIEKDKYQFGLTKVFLRAAQIERLERSRMSRINECAVIVQKNVRRLIQVKLYKKAKIAIDFMQICARQGFAYRDYLVIKKIACTSIIQARLRGQVAHAQHLRKKACAIRIQQAVRQFQAKKRFAQRRRQLELLVVLQSSIRGFAVRRVYQERLFQAKSLEALKNQKVELEQRVKQLELQSKSQVEVCRETAFCC